MKSLTTLFLVVALISVNVPNLFSQSNDPINTGTIIGTVTEVEVEAEDTTIVDFALSPIPPELITASPGLVSVAISPQYGDISGYVTDSVTGEPLEGLTVTLEDGGYTSVTGADGYFSFGELEPGIYEVCTGGGCYFYECQTVELEPGESVELIFNLVPIPTPELTISVTGWDLSFTIDLEIPSYINETLDGFYLYRDGELLTDELVGELFYLEAHPAGEYTFTATAVFNNSESCPSEEVIINVDPLLYGEVFHLANGQPIEGAMITCNGDTTLTDENGEYQLSVGYETHMVKVEYEGCNTVEEEVTVNGHHEWNVGMTEPLMQIEPGQLYFEVPCVPGPEPLYISNNGNGELNWMASVVYEEEEDWLIIPEINGSIDPGEMETLFITADVEGLESQTYHAQLIIHSSPDVGCDTVDVTLEVTIGLEELSSESMHIYPNPADEILTIEGSRGIKSFSVHTLSGQKLREIALNGADIKELDVSAFEPGVYILKFFNTEGVIFSRRLIVE